MIRLAVKEIAEAQGIDFVQLKASTKLAYGTLIRYWVGETRNVSLDALEKIAKALRVNIEILLRDDCPLELSNEEREEMFLLDQGLKVRDNLRRATRAGTDATLTTTQWHKTLDHFDRKCAYCGGKYDVLEHILSIANGGGTTAKNCAPACYQCNTLKDRTTGDILSQEVIKRVQNELITLFPD